jgi:hypothetical protein
MMACDDQATRDDGGLRPSRKGLGPHEATSCRRTFDGVIKTRCVNDAKDNPRSYSLFTTAIMFRRPWPIRSEGTFAIIERRSFRFNCKLNNVTESSRRSPRLEGSNRLEKE